MYLTDRETVNKTERMKVTTCLNPLHTAMSVYGCMLGYTLICDEMKDADIVALIKRLGYVEGLPVVVDPGILEPEGLHRRSRRAAPAQPLHARHAAAHRHRYFPEGRHPLRRDHQELHRRGPRPESPLVYAFLWPWPAGCATCWLWTTTAMPLKSLLIP